MKYSFMFFLLEQKEPKIQDFINFSVNHPAICRAIGAHGLSLFFTQCRYLQSLSRATAKITV